MHVLIAAPPVSCVEAVGHWDGKETAGILYTGTCEECGIGLVGTGRAGAEAPEMITWSRA